LKVVSRSATRARTQASNQISQLLVTAPEDLRERLHGAPLDLLETGTAFRVRDNDDTLAAITRLALCDLARRVEHLDEQLARTKARLARITAVVAPEPVAVCGLGPDVVGTTAAHCR